ncbi:MAG: menaquinone biosynthesis protein [Acidobacteria bacterium]|nr:menaquinone biosynthesis protein [Acidobacteriota bacterium]
MSSPRISASSYSNTAPLVWSFQYGSRRGSVELILDTAPARSAELLAQKLVSAALVPVIAYQTIPDVRLVPDVCVGARERVQSVCLVTSGKDLRDVKSVALDISSKTSVALTRIIFREFLGFEADFKPAEPNIDAMLAESDCALLIGDPALSISDSGLGIGDLSTRGEAFQNSKSEITNHNSEIRKYDLVELWRESTGFGFVFAMWMTTRDRIEIDFAGARDEGLNHVEEIIANYGSGIPLTHDQFKQYLSSNISYSIDDSMQKGLELYFQLAQKNGLIERAAPLRFVE